MAVIHTEKGLCGADAGFPQGPILPPSLPGSSQPHREADTSTGCMTTRGRADGDTSLGMLDCGKGCG